MRLTQNFILRVKHIWFRARIHGIWSSTQEAEEAPLLRATGARVQIPPAPLTERKRQSEYSGCLFSFCYYDMKITVSTSYSQYLQSYKGNVEYDRETEND